MSTTPLESDIQSAWELATIALTCNYLDSQIVHDLSELLRDCAVRTDGTGFPRGASELTASESQECVEDCPVCCRTNGIHVEVEEGGQVRVWAERE